MNNAFPDASPSSPDDTERLLRARIRETTPEFEARFESLRRRLAHEPPRPTWRAWLGAWFRPLSPLTVSLAAAAAALVFVLVLNVTLSRRGELSERELAAFGELVALDDTLRAGLVIADAETLDALLLMPIDENGGRS